MIDQRDDTEMSENTIEVEVGIELGCREVVDLRYMCP
jgi:hypothetical protein